MTNLVNREEFNQCRDRVNPVADVTRMKVSIARDVYTCTETKQRRNSFDFENEINRINKEFLGYDEYSS